MGFISSLMPLILIFLIFYLLIIRPQRIKEKKHQNMLQNLSKGDQVVTVGGLHGTIVGLTDDIVVLRVAEDVKVEVSRNAIAYLKKGGELIEGE
ncbi:preprotein translocase subunit YajC [Candidatus Poribacteria bacterium]|nr:preprotein translocase subunit YajC [Candidatus Poribacteria bacterium]